MLKPSEIDLLRQDLKAALSVVGPDEIDDARALMAEYGFRDDQFVITQQPDPSPTHVSSIAGKITITQMSGDRTTRTYDAGSSSTWLADLEVDLKSGVFDAAIIAQALRTLRQ